MGNLYGTTRWQHMRSRQLALAPLCVLCKALGHVEPASVADHVQPHRGDESKFFDAGNLQSLCQSCHDSVKQAQEKSGHLRGSDATGLPLDSRHPWMRNIDE